MTNASRLPHPLNAVAPMEVKPSPKMVTDLRFPHPANALAGIPVTEAGIVTRTARVFPANTSALNAVTGLPPRVSGIVRFVVSNETPVTVPPFYVHTLPASSVHVSSAHAPQGVNVAMTAARAAATVPIIRFMLFTFLCPVRDFRRDVRLSMRWKDKERGVFLRLPCLPVRPTKARSENMKAQNTPGNTPRRASPDMSFATDSWSFHRNDVVRVQRVLVSRPQVFSPVSQNTMTPA